MIDNFKITTESAKRLRYFSFFLFFITVVLLILVNLTKKWLLIIPAFFSFLFLLWLFLSRKKLLGQDIELWEDHIVYRMTADEVVSLDYKDITFAGFYQKKPGTALFGFRDGLYVYSEKVDRYYQIGPDFERRDVLYATVKENCRKYQIPWIDVQRERKDSLVIELKRLLEERAAT